MLRAAGARERDTAQLAEGMVSNPMQVPVRIGDVSSVGEVEGLAKIERENQQYIRSMTYDFRGPQKLADRTHKAFMQSITAPPGYTVTDERGYGFGDDSAKGLGNVFLLGIRARAARGGAGIRFGVGGGDGVCGTSDGARRRGRGVLDHEDGVHAGSGGRRDPGGGPGGESLDPADRCRTCRRGGESGNRLTMADALHAATDRVTMIVLVTLTTLASLTPMAVGTKLGFVVRGDRAGDGGRDGGGDARGDVRAAGGVDGVQASRRSPTATPPSTDIRLPAPS